MIIPKEELLNNFKSTEDIIMDSNRKTNKDYILDTVVSIMKEVL